MRNLLRATRSHEDSKVNFVELFFDLVYVFAITQLAHTLLHHFALSGLGEVAFLMLAVWWVWMYTTWATNWLNTNSTPVRLVLFSQMLGGLVMAVAIPRAFGEMGFAFAAAYVFMQVSRSWFMVWSLRTGDPGTRKSFLRLSLWKCFSGVLWIVGAFQPYEVRWLIWGGALAIEYVGPFAFYWVPGLGRATTRDWSISGAHMAERCGLFLIIALGESLLMTGAAFAELPWNPVNVGAAFIAFSSTIALWWVYFNIGAEHAARRIEQSDDPGRMGRLAYTYLHIPLVAGLILVAVSDEFILSHPMGRAGLLPGFAIIGGPVIYLLGNLLFKRAVFGKFASSHLVGLALLGATAFLLPHNPPLTLAGIAAAIMVVVGAWEDIAVNRRHHKIQPEGEQVLGKAAHKTAS